MGLLTLGGCGGPSAAGESHDGTVTVRLGYFPNLTHAAAIVGIRKGYFAKELGTAATLEPHTFNAGPDEVTALLSGAIDVGYMGPNPTINAYQKSHFLLLEHRTDAPQTRPRGVVTGTGTMASCTSLPELTTRCARSSCWRAATASA